MTGPLISPTSPTAAARNSSSMKVKKPNSRAVTEARRAEYPPNSALEERLLSEVIDKARQERSCELRFFEVDVLQGVKPPVDFIPVHADASNLNFAEDTVYTTTSNGCGGAPSNK